MSAGVVLKRGSPRGPPTEMYKLHGHATACPDGAVKPGTFVGASLPRHGGVKPPLHHAALKGGANTLCMARCEMPEPWSAVAAATAFRLRSLRQNRH